MLSKHTSHGETAAGAHPRVSDVRSHIPESCRRPSLLRGLTLFLGGYSLYAATQLGIVALPGWPVKALCLLLNALSLAFLYFVAHEACHGSLTPSGPLNRWVGRLAFLPCLHPYTTWVISHNRLHHGFTNLRGKDYVWAPLAKEEFDRLPTLRRGLERLYRTLAGVGLYYLIELWWKHLIVPRAADRARVRNRLVCTLDRLCVLGFPVCQAVLLYAGQRSLARRFSWPEMQAGHLLLALVLPFLLLCWAAGLVTFLHHTHPKVRWYTDKREWSYFRGQVVGTVHVELPWPLGLVLHNVMEHTAHHVDTKVPLYHLENCQRSLEEAYPDVIVHRLTLGSLLRLFSMCQLYDYENHRWLDFAGNPTG